ncbi:hypothetical protein ARMGADRAFT_585617 [Armillaria gallica]|uniref:Uncharacterized protein n=1 Tax=Armillaria gallica TaxID=47427 RepID=A0A2H3DTU6_ARMGA|nr:hypothetical protein ARMGADRAFT_585617 [Armillaria gallica]
MRYTKVYSNTHTRLEQVCPFSSMYLWEPIWNEQDSTTRLANWRCSQACTSWTADGKIPQPLSQSRVGRILRLSSYSTSHEWPTGRKFSATICLWQIAWLHLCQLPFTAYFRTAPKHIGVSMAESPGPAKMPHSLIYTTRRPFMVERHVGLA